MQPESDNMETVCLAFLRQMYMPTHQICLYALGTHEYNNNLELNKYARHCYPLEARERQSKGRERPEETCRERQATAEIFTDMYAGRKAERP